MRKSERANEAIRLLEDKYPEAICSLNYSDPFQLLIATRLSVQCTDERVNKVTPQLFKVYPNAKAMANAEPEQIEILIKSCGLYKTKAMDLIGIAKGICERFEGKIPDTIDELITLPGVGRKTANLICGDVFGKSAVVTDTHLIRLANRLELVNSFVPFKVETQLRMILPPEKSNDFCHRAVLLGREICTARKAYCDICPLKTICPKKIKKI